MEHPERHLWLAVVEQALDDVRFEPYDSLLFNQATAFFVGAGDWRQSRAEIADLIGVSVRQIQAVGLAALNSRRVEQGLPPVHPRPATSRAPRPVARPVEVAAPRVARRPLPLLVAIPGPEPAPAPQRTRGGWPRWGLHNPFNPFRPLPSECVDAAD